MNNVGKKPNLILEQYPYLRFPSTWEVAVTSPYPYAEVRFLVRKRGSDKLGVSVYLDTDGSLGTSRTPYWEIYPYCDGNTRRFSLGEEEKMLRAIRCALASGCSV